MRLIGKVVSLFISVKGIDKRVEQSVIEVTTEGVMGDKFYAKETDRSVLITSVESYHLATNKDITIEYGELGENILIDYNPYAFSLGSQIFIGEAILEITQNCTLCKSLTKIDNKLPKLLKDDRGVFAKVIKAGKISHNSHIEII
ncbi:MAG TPA: MOSC domain-containing protein [Campylobacterales bacterium]|nr:MOSC domain-containing protein [Campylobacterales bacterium]HIP42222.1 MOSC domain-containing protein [Campylobacterales bacterium]